MSFMNFRPYVKKADKLKNAQKETDKMRKKGVSVSPVIIDGRTIAKSVWGKAWCDALESHADYENRLPRGRTYVRNGSVVHLHAQGNRVEAKVAGSSVYTVEIEFTPVAKSQWSTIRKTCSGKIASLVELLAGRVPEAVMNVVSEKDTGLFPRPGHMSCRCSCPDWALMCKHVAAVLYGIGARLDKEPEILFALRGVNHKELLPEVKDLVRKKKSPALSDADLADVFGIDFASPAATPPRKPASPQVKTKRAIPMKGAKQDTRNKTSAKASSRKSTSKMNKASR